ASVPRLAEPIADPRPATLELVDDAAHRGRVDVHLPRQSGEERCERSGKTHVGHCQWTTATSMDEIPGRYAAISSQLSPSSRLANTCPVLVPKYRPGASSPSIAIASRSTP